jgi:hypothetical protein
MVHANQYHPLPEQSGLVQNEAWEITVKQLLPGLLWRQRYQQSFEVSAMAVQSSQPSTSQPVPPVSYASILLRPILLTEPVSRKRPIRQI